MRAPPSDFHGSPGGRAPGPKSSESYDTTEVVPLAKQSSTLLHDEAAPSPITTKYSSSRRLTVSGLDSSDSPALATSALLPVTRAKAFRTVSLAGAPSAFSKLSVICIAISSVLYALRTRSVPFPCFPVGRLSGRRIRCPPTTPGPSSPWLGWTATEVPHPIFNQRRRFQKQRRT